MESLETQKRFEPESVADVAEIVRQSSLVVPVGNQTKPVLSNFPDATFVSTSKLTGVLRYEPREYTFTARAGTPVEEVVEMLSKKSQYLPFDPVQFAPGGSTLAGLVATGIAGSGRYRYGGIRDFLVGVEMVTGYAAVVRGGGVVVKNAAGFDIPKLVTASLGRLGVLTELSFKVFPIATSKRTVTIPCDSAKAALDVIRQLGRQRYEIDAVDYFQSGTVEVRLAGPEQAVEEMASEIAKDYSGDLRDDPSAEELWRRVAHLADFQDCETLIRVPLTPASFETWIASPPPVTFHLASGGNSLWIGCQNDQVESINQSLQEIGISGLLLRGPAQDPVIGQSIDTELQQRIKQVFDPNNKLPS